LGAHLPPEQPPKRSMFTGVKELGSTPFRARDMEAFQIWPEIVAPYT
jgi:hypothetical protein